MTLAPANPHGPLREIFPDVFMVSGLMKMKSPPVGFSRNMIVVRERESLTLISSMRLSEDGLAALDRLGKVEHVIRVAAFHGVDDPFYKERYGATVWAVEGSRYLRGFETKGGSDYFEPDVWMTVDTELPIADAELLVIESATPMEGLVLLEREGGILVSGDALQNWRRKDEHFTLLGKLMMRLMGFIKPFNVGPGWFKGTKPEIAELERLLDLRFEHVLPTHGSEVIGGARGKFRPAIERLAGA